VAHNDTRAVVALLVPAIHVEYRRACKVGKTVLDVDHAVVGQARILECTDTEIDEHDIKLVGGTALVFPVIDLGTGKAVRFPALGAIDEITLAECLVHRAIKIRGSGWQVLVVCRGSTYIKV